MQRSIRIAIVAALLAALLVPAGAASAAGRMYYLVAHGGGETSSILSSRPDGTGMRTVVAKAGRYGLLRASGGYLYWTHAEGTSIARARMDGSHVQLHFIKAPAGTTILGGLAVAGGCVFYTAAEGGAKGQSYRSVVERACLAHPGRSRRVLRLPVGIVAVGIAADARHLYLAAGLTKLVSVIYRVDHDGTHRRTLVRLAGSRVRDAVDLVVAGDRIYFGGTYPWNGNFGLAIGRVDVDGSHYRTLFRKRNNEAVYGVGVSAGRVFVATLNATTRHSTISSVRASGGGYKHLSTASAGNLYIGLAVLEPTAIALGPGMLAPGAATFQVTVPGPGMVTLRGVRAGGGRDVVCSAGRRVNAAGTVTISCIPVAATAAGRDVRAVVRVAFYGDDATVGSDVRTVTIPRVEPAPVAG